MAQIESVSIEVRIDSDEMVRRLSEARKAAREFDDAMARVREAVSVTEDQVRAMVEKLRELAEEQS